MATFLGLVWLIHRRIFLELTSNTPLSLALSLLVLQIISIITQLFASCAAKSFDERQRRREAVLIPVVRKAIAEHIAGDDRVPELRALQKKSSEVVERCLIEFLSIVDGVTRDTLSELARSLRYVSRWEATVYAQDRRSRKKATEYLGMLSRGYGKAALRVAFCDPAALVRTAASRALLRNGGRAEAEEVFRPLLDRPLVDRVLLANELADHAGDLCSQALPRVLDSGHMNRSLLVLELALAWERVLHLPMARELTSHPSPELQAAALRLLPLTCSAAEAEPYILRALDSGHEDVVAAAAFAGAKLRLPGSVAFLKRVLAHSDAGIVREACSALGKLGVVGRRTLEDEILKADQRSAAYALEALSQPRLHAVAAGAGS